MGRVPRELVIIVGSPSLRSMLVARLGLAGETFRTLDALANAHAALSTRRDTFLIVDSAVLSGEPDGWHGVLDGAGWGGTVALLCREDAHLTASSERVRPIDGRRSGKAIVDDILAWCDTRVQS